MLIEERKQQIIEFVEKNRGASVQELMALLKASESTIRRDLTELDRKGLLVKVHGGALAITREVTSDTAVSEREYLNRDQKIQIARYAASLITDDDIVYLDAGTSTEFLPDYLDCKDTVFVTNAIAHARKLGNLGYQVYLPGGFLKDQTEALTGADTCEYLSRFHFTKGFFGANGLSFRQGCTTPDVQEANVKEMAIRHCKNCYVLCDSSKFDTISTITFASFSDVHILTDSDIPESYRKYKNITIVS